MRLLGSMLRKIILSAIFVFSFVARGGELILEIEQDSPDVEKAVQNAMNQVSAELMEKFIEPSKLKERKKQIQKIISTSSNRYILYTKTSTPTHKADSSYVIPVTIGFSEENLKKILLEEDLFYPGTSQLRVLPMVFFENLMDKEHYGWWMRGKSKSIDMKEQMNSFYNQIQSTMMSYGFFLINPEFAGSFYFVPDDLLFKRPIKKNIFKLARFFKSHLVMTGSIKVRESDIKSMVNVKVDLVVYHTDSGRLLAEVERFKKIKIEENGEKNVKPLMIFLKENKDFAKGLGTQLKSIYETGQMASHLFSVIIQGEMSYKDSHKFKQLLISKVTDITALQENVIKSDSVTYIAHIKGSYKKVVKEIKDVVFPGFYVRVSHVKKNEVVLKVVPKE